MDLRDRSLELNGAGDDDHGRTWAVFADIALALLLVMVLFILAQFLHYDDVVVLEEIERRRIEVATEIREAATRAPIPPGQVEELSIVSLGFTTQRITFPEPMLFVPCGTVPQPEGQALIQEIGRRLSERGSYFEAVQIEGHADVTPPTGPCQEAVGDNWGLSSMRATGFLRILVDPGVFPRREVVSAVGRGDTQPLSVPGSESDDLSRDRRVELILVYSEEDARQSLRNAGSPEES
jgi:flagellar motor protein MotB